jgi:hypothetical protein
LPSGARLLISAAKELKLKNLNYALNQINNWRFKRSAVALGEKRMSMNLLKNEVLCRGIWSTQKLKDLPGNCRSCDEIDKLPNNQINPTTHLIHKLEGKGIVCRKF